MHLSAFARCQNCGGVAVLRGGCVACNALALHRATFVHQSDSAARHSFTRATASRRRGAGELSRDGIVGCVCRAGIAVSLGSVRFGQVLKVHIGDKCPIQLMNPALCEVPRPSEAGFCVAASYVMEYPQFCIHLGIHALHSSKILQDAARWSTES